MALIECVPNVSEGRRPEVVERLAQCVRDIRGVRLLDHSADREHNRSVFTIVGEARPLQDAVLSLCDHAIAAIDMRTQTGAHPRIGAVDVVPFVPIETTTLAECVALARATGAEMARRFRVPVYLYEAAASDPARRKLEDIRRGQFEALATHMLRPGWAPDFGPRTPHPRAGASVVGARMPLIAYNINLATDRLDVARRIAATVRHSGGGLPHVKAIGVALRDRGVVQVSMNLTNYQSTPIMRVFEAVCREARRHGVEPVEHELIGLIPRAALAGLSEAFHQLGVIRENQILETRLQQTSEG
ncbi:MAG: glutamate formimidoyltransferase [Acidobacteria bacterium]|nr:glutamate formimidoyltransferase [Acidobacteriota bacterium]